MFHVKHFGFETAYGYDTYFYRSISVKLAVNQPATTPCVNPFLRAAGSTYRDLARRGKATGGARRGAGALRARRAWRPGLARLCRDLAAGRLLPGSLPVPVHGLGSQTVRRPVERRGPGSEQG